MGDSQDAPVVRVWRALFMLFQVRESQALTAQQNLPNVGREKVGREGERGEEGKGVGGG